MYNQVYTLSGEILQTIEHNDGWDASWGSKTLGDYQVNKHLQAVSPGIYIWHVTTMLPLIKAKPKWEPLIIMLTIKNIWRYICSLKL